MRSDLLHVVAVYSNPIRWASRCRLHRQFEEHMLDSGVQLTTVECAFGDRPFELGCTTERHAGINRVQVRASTLVWNKESLINIGISRLPAGWKYAAWVDADIRFRRPDWAAQTVHELQLYQIVQPWTECYDLGPDDTHVQVDHSFCKLWYHHPHTCVPRGKPWWKHDGGPYDHCHPGYAWAATRDAIERMGGLFELSALGEGDNVMARAMIGAVHSALPEKIHPRYREHALRWQERALAHIGHRIGYVKGTIEHFFHGPKRKRRYVGRWDILLRHDFNPDEDLKRNTFGVIELAGNKHRLTHDIDHYFRQRNEDANVID